MLYDPSDNYRIGEGIHFYIAKTIGVAPCESNLPLAVSARVEFRITVLACTVWVLLLQAYQLWRYPSSRHHQFLDQTTSFVWQIGFNGSHNPFAAILAGLFSIACLVYLSGWVVRGFRETDSIRSASGPPDFHKTAPIENETPAVHRHWRDLPEVVQRRLLARQTGKGFNGTSEHWQFTTVRKASSWAAVAAFIVWVGVLTFSWRYLQSLQSRQLWAAVVTGCGAFFAYRRAVSLFRWRRAHLKPFLYVTRLYFIRTDADDVWIWPYTDLREVATRSGATRSVLQFEFADWRHSVVAETSEAVRFQAELERWHRESEEALRRNVFNYVITHDDFLGLREKGPIQSTPYRGRDSFFSLSIECVCGMLVGLVIVSGVEQLNRLKLFSPQPWEFTTAAPVAPASSPPFSAPEPQGTEKVLIAEFAEPSQLGASKGCQAPLPSDQQYRPENGKEITSPWSREGHGKLTVDNGNPEDAAVLVSSLVPDSDDRLIYVRAGMTAIMGGLGPGLYRVAFQLGREWDEQAEAFTCVSGTSIFDETASFEEMETADGLEYSNIRVTLHKLVGGNARTSPVAPTAFRRRRK